MKGCQSSVLRKFSFGPYRINFVRGIDFWWKCHTSSFWGRKFEVNISLNFLKFDAEMNSYGSESARNRFFVQNWLEMNQTIIFWWRLQPFITNCLKSDGFFRTNRRFSATKAAETRQSHLPLSCRASNLHGLPINQISNRNASQNKRNSLAP